MFSLYCRICQLSLGTFFSGKTDTKNKSCCSAAETVSDFIEKVGWWDAVRKGDRELGRCMYFGTAHAGKADREVARNLGRKPGSKIGKELGREATTKASLVDGKELGRKIGRGLGSKIDLELDMEIGLELVRETGLEFDREIG